MEIAGTVLAGDGYEPIEGRVIVDDGEITAIEEGPVDSTDIVLPSFVNGHTHLGDSIAKEAGDPGMSLAELVAPPDGLKHRLLRAADRSELVDAMARSLSFMAASGTSACLEFREGGVPGVEMMREAAADRRIDPVILGRETADAMAIADGFGASGANDGEFGAERTATREADKLFGIHAGEGDATDVDAALDLDPDFLVHMIHATDDQLARVERESVPIVCCPRSNLATGVGLPPVDEHADRTTVALGTDNAMFASPSMFREMEFAARLFDLTPTQVLRMATGNGAAIAGLDRGVIDAGRPAHLLVLDGDSDNLAGVRDPVRAAVRRAGAGDVKRVIRPADDE